MIAFSIFVKRVDISDLEVVAEALWEGRDLDGFMLVYYLELYLLVFTTA